jgi:hypothetical protein
MEKHEIFNMGCSPTLQFAVLALQIVKIEFPAPI